jgi:hypothetical protein
MSYQVLWKRDFNLPFRSRHHTSAEASGGGARHTRALSVGVLAVVADCRRLRFRRGVSGVLAVSRARQSWAIPGPSDAAQQRGCSRPEQQRHGALLRALYRLAV